MRRVDTPLFFTQITSVKSQQLYKVSIIITLLVTFEATKAQGVSVTCLQSPHWVMPARTVWGNCVSHIFTRLDPSSHYTVHSVAQLRECNLASFSASQKSK